MVYFLMTLRPTRQNSAEQNHPPQSIPPPETLRFMAGLAITLLLLALAPGHLSANDGTTFQQFTRHIGTQIHHDKQAFAFANTCMSWFYHKAKTRPPVSQGISWTMTQASRTEVDCPRSYPGGMDEVRDDFAKTQSRLSVSLTFYEFALVADRNDDTHYSQAELQDLFRALSLAYETGVPASIQIAALTKQFDSWYGARNMDALMQGMSDLYERGYRVTPLDRIELDRVMG